jgi:hypothetical protein
MFPGDFMRFVRFSVFVLAALAPLAGFAQSTPAGTVTLLNGQAQVTGPNGGHALAKGDAVYGGDVVETGAASYTLIRFTDQGSVLLRPKSRFQVEQYQYAAAAPQAVAPAAPPPAASGTLAPLQASPGASAGDSSFFRLLKGGLRAVSGLIAHADYSRYRMSTPVATMGIRGTDYDVVMCEETCVSDPTVVNSIPAGKTAAGGVVSGVNEGQIVVTSYTGNSITLGPGQYAITLADGSQYLLNGLPAFLQTSSAGAGTAAGGAAAAASAAHGSALTAAAGGVAAAAIIGVVIGTSSDNGGGSTATATSTSTSTAR